MNYISYQGNDNDCGFASLKMLLANLSKNKSYLYLDKLEKRKCYSFSDLINIASEHGLSLKAYVDDDKDLSFIDNSPGLVNLNDNVTYNNHLVYVYKIKRNKVYYNDPNIGACVLSVDKFSELWDGSYLEVESNKIRPFKAQRQKIMPLSRRIPSFILQTLSMVSLVVGFFYVKEDEHIILPLIFIVAFSVFELVENWYIIKNIKYFDDNYLRSFMEGSASGRKEAYKEYLVFKQLYFTTPRNALINILLIAIIVTVLILNNPLNAYAILFFLVVAIIDQLITKKENSDHELTMNENAIINSNEEDYIDNLLLLCERANKKVFNFSIKKCLYTFLLLVASILLMVASNLMSTNFIIFTFGIYYVLFDQMSKLICFDDDNSKYLRAKARFMDNIFISQK